MGGWIDVLSEGEKQELRDAWSKAATKEPIRDAETKFRAFGVNIRINLVEALKAAWSTAKAYVKAQAMHATGQMSSEDIASFGSDVIAAVTATIEAVREKMDPRDYVASVVLANEPNGLSEADFRKRLDAFLGGDEYKSLPWYLGLNREMIDAAKGTLKDDGDFKDMLASLRKDDWLKDLDGGKIAVKSRNFVWGFKSE